MAPYDARGAMAPYDARGALGPYDAPATSSRSEGRTPEALIGEVKEAVLEQLRTFRDALLRQHEEQEAKLAMIFDSVLEHRHPDRDRALARAEERQLATRAAPEALKEPHGLERVGRELARLQQHVSRELALISKEVVLERAARAKDPHSGRTLLTRPVVAAAPARHNAPLPARPPPPARDEEAFQAIEPEAPMREEEDEVRRVRSKEQPSSEGAHSGAVEDAPPRSEAPPENSPKGMASWQKGLSARERACKTPLEHLGLFTF